METSKPWSNIFKFLRKYNFKFSLSFKSKGKIKTFKKIWKISDK